MCSCPDYNFAAQESSTDKISGCMLSILSTSVLPIDSDLGGTSTVNEWPVKRFLFIRGLRMRIDNSTLIHENIQLLI